MLTPFRILVVCAITSAAYPLDSEIVLSTEGARAGGVEKRRSAQASRAPFTAPVLGLVASDGDTVIRPVLGVPGASTLGEPLTLALRTTRIYLIPTQTRALAEQADGTLGLMDLSSGTGAEIQPISGSAIKPATVRFSPAGRSALLLLADGSLQTLASLDNVPRVAMEVGRSQLPPDAIASAAISDDGTLVALVLESGDVDLVSAGQAPQPIFRTGQPSAIAFLPNRRALAVADGSTGTVSLVEDLDGRWATRTLGVTSPASGVMFMASSRDASSLFIACRGLNRAVRLDAATGESWNIEIPVGTTRLDRVGTTDLFLLSAEPGDAAWLLHAEAGDARVIFAAPSRPGLEPADGRN